MSCHAALGPGSCIDIAIAELRSRGRGGPVRPSWVHDQRISWDGVGFPYHSHFETLLAVDEDIPRIMAALEARSELDDTLIL